MQDHMQDYKKRFEIPETEKRSWQTIYREVMEALFDPQIDGPKMSGSSGGPIGKKAKKVEKAINTTKNKNVTDEKNEEAEGVWVICESRKDPKALYLYVLISGKDLRIDARNVTDEKVEKISKVCRGFREVANE